MRHATILVAILAFTPLHSATAQVQPGAKVRVTIPPHCPAICTGQLPRRYVGTIVAWKADSLVIESNGDTLAMPLDAVMPLEVVRGQKHYVVEGLVVGMLVGIPIGMAIAAAVTPEEKECGSDSFGKRSHGTCIQQGGIIGFLGGTLVGALIGAGIRSDRWQEVSLSRLRVSLGPQRDGRLGFGASVRF